MRLQFHENSIKIDTFFLLCTEGKKVKDYADAVPTVSGSNDVFHTSKDLVSSRPVLAHIPRSSDFCDTLGSSIERALSCLRLFVGRGDASKAEDQQCDGEAHDEVDAVDAD